MVIPSQIYSENDSDFALFGTAYEILGAMRDHGDLAATEFYDNLECVQQCLDKSSGLVSQHISLSSHLPGHGSPDTISFLTEPAHGPSEVTLGETPNLPDATALGNPTDDMMFLDQSMEDF